MVPPEPAAAGTPEDRARALAAMIRPLRWTGLMLVVGGFALVAGIDHVAARIIGWSLVALGWLHVAAGIALRVAWQRARRR